ncbi:MAG TPA: hypothetical protein VJ276_05025 [Thermoanaerobaculia bacterium]|nr:hypothetical protein [Thermoanaerobaculia bacterium]
MSRDLVYTSLGRRIDVRVIHRGTKIANLIPSREERRNLWRDLMRNAPLREQDASALDYMRVNDLLTIIYNALPGQTTTKPSGGD